MNPWLTTAFVLLLAGAPPTVRAVTTGPLRRRVTGQNTATLLFCLVLLLLAQGYGRPSYTDVALLLALLGPAGTLVFARLLADDLPTARRQMYVTIVLAAVLTAGVLVPLCLAAPPGRTTVKLLLTGALLVAGNLVAGLATGVLHAVHPSGGGTSPHWTVTGVLLGLLVLPGVLGT
ncbi:monovalent cation/H+ antiporter complex subunit F [Streptomyces sp. NPDC026672]|uniref:monovalent cation/H+ antiporter complex subunit F n=1 Tax=unclassified Streptomyces TaxID=2593676 RepID=UPI0033D2940C